MGWALNSAVECHLHTVEVAGSNPAAPTIFSSFISRFSALRGSLRSLPGVADSPDRVRTVVAHQQRTIRSHGYTYGTSPDVAIRQYEAGEEVFILTAGMSGLMQRHADHLIAHTHCLVPGTVLGGENVSLVLCRELLAFIEGKLQGGVMGLQQDIRDDGFVLQFGMLALKPRIPMPADVPPGPAVESAFLNVRDVVGDQIVAERVALIH